MQNPTISHKIDAWNHAKILVDEVVEQYGIDAYTDKDHLADYPPVTHTQADQYVGYIIRVADWLLEEMEN